jgi:PAS domain S-box-containing protein
MNDNNNNDQTKEHLTTRFKQLFEGMSSGVAIYEAVDGGNDFIFKDLNRAGEEIEDVKREDIIGRRVTEAFPGVEEFGLLEVLRQVWKTGSSRNHPITFYQDQRITGWRENYIYKLPSGEVVAIYDDITERKRAEEELKAANRQLTAGEQQLRAANQQLTATEQQLRSANQQLDASNQQLRASEQELRTVNLTLRDRVKELDYFFNLSALVEKPEITLEELLQGAADLIPSAWRYPEITRGRIILEDQEFKTENFEETPWKQASDIFVRGDRAGSIEVYYLEETPESDEGPFLREEKKLLDAIAERLGKIAERKQAEEAFKKSELEYRSTVNGLLVGVVVHGSDSSVLLSNPEASSILGLTPEQMSGKKSIDPAWHFMNEDTSKMPIEDYPISKVIATGEPLYDYILGISRPDRDYTTWVNVNAIPMLSREGELEKVIINFIDITERKRDQEELLQKERKFRSIFESDMVGIMYWDKQGNILEANEAFLEMVKYPKKDILSGKIRWKDMTPPEYIPQDEKAAKEIADTGVCTPYEKEYICGDGSRIPIILGASALGEDAGRGVGFILDNTEFKKAEKEIRELAKFPSENPNPVLRISRDGMVLYANEGAGDVLKNWNTEINKEVPEKWKQLAKETLKTGRSRLEEEINGDRFLSFSASAIAGANYITLYARDITARWKAEEKLKKYSENLETLVAERTAELKTRINELERLHDAMVDREFRIKELRDEVEKYKTQIDTNRNTDSHRSPEGGSL